MDTSLVTRDQASHRAAGASMACQTQQYHPATKRAQFLLTLRQGHIRRRQPQDTVRGCKLAEVGMQAAYRTPVYGVSALTQPPPLLPPFPLLLSIGASAELGVA